MNQEEKSLIIADDHPIFRHGVRSILSEIPWIKIVGEAETGTSALTQVKHLQPDIILLDLEMPGMDGLSVLKEISRTQTSTLVVILTSYDDEAYLEKALELGASAYVLKDEAGDTLLSCLQAICSDSIYISPSLGSKTLVSPDGLDKEKDLLKSLTDTELKILTAVAKFKTSKEIARELDLSYRTIQNHRANICKKLGLKGSHQLMQFAKNNL